MYICSAISISSIKLYILVAIEATKWHDNFDTLNFFIGLYIYLVTSRERLCCVQSVSRLEDPRKIMN